MNATDPLVVTARDEHGTRRLAAALARNCRSGDCILLSGDLGAGKTTFARGFIQAISGETEEVVSPTFTLMQSYRAANGGMIHHFDFYRLKQAREALDIGLEEALAEGITLIEWPALVEDVLPDTALHVEMAFAPGGRAITFAGGKAWRERLSGLELS